VHEDDGVAQALVYVVNPPRRAGVEKKWDVNGYSDRSSHPRSSTPAERLSFFMRHLLVTRSR
jgi:hypothetical protein